MGASAELPVQPKSANLVFKSGLSNLLSWLGFLLFSSLGSSATRPNVIVVFIDDMGYSDFSCFGGAVETQHIDRLASEGIKFTNFYVNSPICSPSRVAL
ncbi:sulfatase-like hydrolase/transferase, partial [Akkermansiaceae bacterium]|nr:sulfatase-like hydrolase/transferase [Akkermansiaceae bacterium]